MANLVFFFSVLISLTPQIQIAQLSKEKNSVNVPSFMQFTN